MKEKIKSRRAIFSLIGLTGILLLFFGGGGHLGLFSRVGLEIVDRGPYTVAGIKYEGRYRKIYQQLKFAMKIAEDHNISGFIQAKCAVLYEKPTKAKIHKRQSLVGFIMLKDKEEEITDQFKVEEVAKRQVLLARINAHPAVAFFRSHRKIKKWLRKNEYKQVGPFLEIYHDNGEVELEVPIAPL